MSVSSVHSAPHCRRGLFIEVPLQHQSCVIIRWWPFCWLPGDPGLCTLDLQFSTKEWYVCIVVGQFLCIRGCNENWPLEIGFWEVYLPVNSVSHTFARIFLDGRYAFPSHSPCIHGVLRSACINGVVTRNSHQAAGFLHAWLRHPESFCKFPAPRLWTRLRCGKTHSPALVCVSFLSLLLLAQGNAKPSKISVQGAVSILWASLMREARDRKASSRGAGQVPLKAHLAHRVCLSWWA